MNKSPDPILQVRGLVKYFSVARSLFLRPASFVHAVDNVDFEIGQGEILGLVGESGCGKTTTGKLVVKLLEPDGGNIYLRLNGEYKDTTRLRRSEVKSFRRRIQMIFQDPYESMNPRRTIFDTVAEPLRVHGIGGRSEQEERVVELLNLVGLAPPSDFMFRYPHELSGGQRQRAAVARALILNPSFVVADEPTSMLDVSVRSGIMNLMMELGQRFHVSYLYITHDLAVARYMCHRIAVMYLGKIVEMAETEELLSHPLHPYTKALLSAVPDPDPRVQRGSVEIKGGITSPVDPAPRCRFYERCPIAAEVCRTNDHPLLDHKGRGHHVACYRV